MARLKEATVQMDSLSDVASHLIQQHRYQTSTPPAVVSAGQQKAEVRSPLHHCPSNHDYPIGDDDQLSDMNESKWHLLSRRVRGVLAARNAMVEPGKVKRTSVEQKDTFLERFSTRDTHSNVLRSQGRLSRVARPSKAFIHDGAIITHDTSKKTIHSIEQSTELGKELTAVPETTTTNDERQTTGPSSDSKAWCLHIGNVWNFILEPHSGFAYVWHYLLMVAIHYNCWVLLLRIAFTSTQQQLANGWMVFDYLFDAVYMMDILVSMRTSYLSNGIYVDDKRLVFCKYAKSPSFALDIISLLPFDIFYGWKGIDPIWRLPRLIKAYKTLKAKKIIESVTAMPNAVRAFFLIHLVFLLIHWNACFYFMISKQEGFGSSKWVYPSLSGLHSKPYHQYVHCLYWSTLALTTIGESDGPDTTEANIYMVACYITGVFIFATIVGQAGSVIQNMNTARMDFERQRDNTMIYMKNHRVPRDLQRRVRLWYDYTYSRGRFQGGSDINDVTLLPNKMKTELALHVHLETLRKVTFLQKCPPEFLHDLVLKMKMHIFTPGDYICKKGEVSREMYVVSDGILEVLSEKQHILKVLHPGDFFGEIGILSLSGGQNRRTADVRSCGYVELFVLSKEDVLSATVDYPQAQKILANYGRSRLLKGGKNTAGLRDDTSSESEGEDKTRDEHVTASISDDLKQDDVGKKGFVVEGADRHRRKIVNWHLSARQVNRKNNELSDSGQHRSRGEISPTPSCLRLSSPEGRGDAQDANNNDELRPSSACHTKNSQPHPQPATQSTSDTPTSDDFDSMWMTNLIQSHNEAIKTLKVHFKKRLKKEVLALRSQLEEKQSMVLNLTTELDALRLESNRATTIKKKHGLKMDREDLGFEVQKKNVRIQELEAQVKQLRAANQTDATNMPEA